MTEQHTSDLRNPERQAENMRRYEGILRDHRPDSSPQLRAAFLESMKGREYSANATLDAFDWFWEGWVSGRVLPAATDDEEQTITKLERVREDLAKVALNVKGGFSANIRISSDEQEMVRDINGPWVLNSDIADSIRAHDLTPYESATRQIEGTQEQTHERTFPPSQDDPSSGRPAAVAADLAAGGSDIQTLVLKMRKECREKISAAVATTTTLQRQAEELADARKDAKKIRSDIRRTLNEGKVMYPALRNTFDALLNRYAELDAAPSEGKP